MSSTGHEIATGESRDRGMQMPPENLEGDVYRLRDCLIFTPTVYYNQIARKSRNITAPESLSVESRLST